MRKIAYPLCAFALLLNSTMPAFAATPAELETERLNRELQIRQQEQQKIDERSAKAATQIEVPLPTAPQEKSKTCRDISTITISGASLLPAKRQKEIITPYESTCIGVNEIQQLLAEITGFYIRKGYAASRAYVPEQDLTTGKLEILVVEGKVSGVKLEDAGKQNSVWLKGAFPDVEGKPLNLRDFEQGLDQVNRLSNNSATLDIQPGTEPGESVVVIKNDQKFPASINFSADSYGSRGTGRYQVGSTLTFSDVAGYNEMFSYTRKQSWPFYAHNRNSDSDNLFFSVPYGYATFSFGYSDSNYESRIITPGNAVLALEGDSTNIYGKIDIMAYRSQTDKLNLSVTATQKESNNFAAGQKLQVSSRTLSVIDWDADYSTQAFGGFVNMNSGIAMGTRLFGALEDSNQLAGSVPKAQFVKWKFGAGYTLPFQVFDHSATFSSQLTGQFAFDTLYGSEQISIGGPYSVRGFYDTSLANDHGFYIRNDLSYREPLGNVFGTDLTLKPYVALDAGSVFGRVPKSPNGSLVGTAAGFSLMGGPANFDIFTAKGLVLPTDFDEESFSTFARFSLTF